MKVLVINLESAKDRLNFQKNQLTSLGLEFKILKAINKDFIKPNIYKKYFYDWQRPMRKTEIACYFSHKAAWEFVIKKNEPFLIIEDDALLSKDIKEILLKVGSMNCIDLINFENRGRRKFISKNGLKVSKKHSLYNLYQDRTGAACYLLWPSGAKKLILCEKKNGIALADAHITSCYDINSYQLEPSAAIQLDYCTHYKIKNPANINLSFSTVSKQSNPKGGPVFWAKRIFHQLKLGYRQITLIRKSQRRYIKINSTDFEYRI